MNLEALLLLGPTGSGKTPLGDWLERVSWRGRRCHHFDFGANLRAAVGGQAGDAFTVEEIRFLRRVLEEGVLLEAEHFPLAARILKAFIGNKGVRPSDWVVLNGLPRHLEQARALDPMLKIIGVIHLKCDASTVVERLRRNSGGDRTQRPDDSGTLVARKLAIYEGRTRPLLDYYRERGVKICNIGVGSETQPEEIVAQLNREGNES